MDQTSSTIIEIDGKRFEIAEKDLTAWMVIERTDELFEVIDGDTTHIVSLIRYDPLARECVLELNGQMKKGIIYRDIDLRIETMGLNTLQSKRLHALIAPMPGLVTIIHVKEGDAVDKGHPLLILEAMKMENVISAPHAAVVKKINVEVGQAVERGLTLLEFV